jgi:hypothetical protein
MQLEQETRGRRSRAEEQLPERRKRTDIDLTGKRLAVRTDLLDFTKFKYRWINDSDVRLFRLTKQDDWDVMTQDGGALKSDSTDMGAAVSIPVGTKPDGSAMNAYLCRKLRRFYDDDQMMKQTELDEQLKRLRLGNDKSGESQGDYVPSGGIRIA